MNVFKPWSPRPSNVSSKGFLSAMNETMSNKYPTRVDTTNAPKQGSVYDYSNIYNKTPSTVPNILTYTENGAMSNSTSGSYLLDINFAVSSLRNANDGVIIQMFRNAFKENPILAMRWLAYASDVREGLGERRLFRIILKDLATHGEYKAVNDLLNFIPELSRWDNLWELLDVKEIKPFVINLVRKQLKTDTNNMKANKPISLMAKWLPSANASSKATKRYALTLIDGLHLTERSYRKRLSELRAYLNVVECKMSAKDWSMIDYEAVPSKANLIYKNAFLRNDEERRRAYLEGLKSGEAKINSSVAYPHEIVHKYMQNYYSWTEDQTLESMWDSLPETLNGWGNSLVVADGSGSMGTFVGQNSNVSASDVACGLTLYLSQYNSGDFKNKFITFSEHPQLVDLSYCKTLNEKIKEYKRHNECANTNIEAVFKLILKTAIEHNMKQDDMPNSIIILSDMEFDRCVTTNMKNAWDFVKPTKTLFKAIEEQFAEHGYKLPRLVFWNIASRTMNVPVRENDLGVTLVSGFSVNTCKMVMSSELDPYKCLVEQIMVPRYDCFEKALLNNFSFKQN